jgi:hypothetical protein
MRKDFLTKKIKWSCLTAGLLLLIVLLYGFLVEPYQVAVHDVWIEDNFLGAALKNKVVVQLSDLHIGSLGRREKKSCPSWINCSPISFS